MTQIFAPSLLENYVLYHLKYGRGAVIVAIRNGSDEASPQEQINSDKHVARLFNARIFGDVKTTPAFDPILSLEEEDGFVRMTIQFEHRNPIQPSYRPVTATIERIIPTSQVTIEIVRTNEST